MKKLGKKLHSEQETIEAYDCTCSCAMECNCGYVDQARYNQYYAYYSQLHGVTNISHRGA